jgi:hypothetical protein
MAAGRALLDCELLIVRWSSLGRAYSNGLAGGRFHSAGHEMCQRSTGTSRFLAPLGTTLSEISLADRRMK